MSWFILALKKSFQFSGRSQRKEYWFFFLFSGLFSAPVAVLLSDVLSPLLFGLAILIPSISLAVRRLHDIGRTGWWALLAIIPILCLVVTVMACFDSEPEENQYGPNPKLEPSI